MFQVEPPKKKPGRTPKIIDEDSKYPVRRKVHSFYSKKEIPTLDYKVLMKLLREDDSIPLISRKLLWKTLKKMDFAWEKHDRKALLLKRDEIV